MAGQAQGVQGCELTCHTESGSQTFAVIMLTWQGIELGLPDGGPAKRGAFGGGPIPVVQRGGQG